MSKTGPTLSIDVGGSGIKGMVLDEDGKPLNDKVRIATPRPAEPQDVLRTIAELAAQQPDFARVSVGFPGVVQDGVTRNAPNLDGEWADFPLAAEVERITGRPTRAANDADVQGYGVVEGRGVEMVITLGTGMGSSIFIDGILVPNLELGHHPLNKRGSYEDYIDDATRKRLGRKKWTARVLEAVNQMIPIWNPRILWVGGGNAKRLTEELPEPCRIAPNVAGILGGIRLWTNQ